MTENSFDKIKKLIKIVGGKVIIVEDGKPTMVIINVDEYLDFEDAKDKTINNPSKKELPARVEGVNKDINVWKNKQGERMVRQFEVENKFREENDLEDKDSDDTIDDDEIVIEKL
ncbi:MAG: hypothetical protein KAQ87_00915 [Candidatus Pacebacteria bacterium]|nr:hypothetical protein [Candidatus Paceibacterota bacterium]